MLRLIFSMFVLSVVEVKHCKLPGVAINGSSLQNQELFSHITSVVFKVYICAIVSNIKISVVGRLIKFSCG